MRPSESVPPALDNALHRLVRAYILAGLAFMLLPGTFLGVWNLISPSSDNVHHPLSPAWVQAHAHAQIFGWIGTFVIGIGFFSLSKMGPLRASALRCGWLAWAAWICGVLGTWSSGVYGWNWRTVMPASAALECTGYLIFFALVRQHKPKPTATEFPIIHQKPAAWMQVVLLSSTAFLLALFFRLSVAILVALQGTGPQFPPWADRALLGLTAWGFLVLSVWGFNARWLSMFAGFRQVNERVLFRAALLIALGVILTAVGWMTLSAVLLLIAAISATLALHIFDVRPDPTKAAGVYSAFHSFIRIAYSWMLIGATLGIWAASADLNGGITGAGRHALTVGFIGTMVFAIGQRLLPAFCGRPSLFSKNLMLASIGILSAGCLLRVGSEIPAYEFQVALAWKLLPVSAVLELTAVTLFAINLSATILRPHASPVVLQKAA